MGVSALIRERFLAARDYRRKQKEAEAAKKRGETVIAVRTDFQLEAIAEILEGKRTIHAHSYVKQEILDLIRLCEEFGVQVATLQHVLEGYKVADEIAAHGAGASSFSRLVGLQVRGLRRDPVQPGCSCASGESSSRSTPTRTSWRGE